MRNFNKRIKRRDNKIEDLKLQVEALEQETDEQFEQSGNLQDYEIIK